MSVISVKRLWSGRNAAIELGQRRFAVLYRVLTSSLLDDVGTVGPAVGVNIGDPYVGSDGVVDVYAGCIGVYPELEDDGDGQRWLVRCEYSTEGFSADPNGGAAGGGGHFPGQGGQADDPLLEPPEWEWDFETHMAVARSEYADPKNPDAGEEKVILNAAHDPFDPLPEFQTGYPVLTYTRNEPTFDVLKAKKYCFAVNEDTFLGIGPNQAQCLPIRARAVWKGPVRFWKVTYKFRFKLAGTRTFQPTILQAGYRELVGGQQRDILDRFTSMRVSQPQPLENDGTALTQAQIANGIVRWRTLKLYRELPFAPLNIVV